MRLTPEEVARGALVPDTELPLLAAGWLADGYDSPLLRELAGLTRAESMRAKHLLAEVLGELGHPPVTVDGPWSEICWIVDEMDVKFTPYATAQRVLDIAQDTDGLWAYVHGNELAALIELRRDGRGTDDELRATLRRLRNQSPPG